MNCYWLVLQLLENKDRTLDELIELTGSKKSNVRHKLHKLCQDGHKIFKKNAKFTMKRQLCKACDEGMKSINSIVCVKCHLEESFD